MSSPHTPLSPSGPLVNRALLVLGVFTFASWTLIAALLLSWAPARAAAKRTVARVASTWSRTHGPASACTEAPTAAPLEAENAARAAMASFAYGDESGEDGDEFSWSLASGEPDSYGNTRTARFRFRLDGEDYVVRDAALVAEADRVVEPMREIGQEMGVLGGEMGRHGAAMGRLGGRMGALGARMAALETRLATRSASREERDAARARLDAMRSEVSRLHDELSAKQSVHADRQRELSRRMSELSARQREVSREVREQLREIARRALREGKAERPHANA